MHNLEDPMHINKWRLLAWYQCISWTAKQMTRKYSQLTYLIIALLNMSPTKEVVVGVLTRKDSGADY